MNLTTVRWAFLLTAATIGSGCATTTTEHHSIPDTNLPLHVQNEHNSAFLDFLADLAGPWISDRQSYVTYHSFYRVDDTAIEWEFRHAAWGKPTSLNRSRLTLDSSNGTIIETSLTSGSGSEAKRAIRSPDGGFELVYAFLDDNRSAEERSFISEWLTMDFSRLSANEATILLNPHVLLTLEEAEARWEDFAEGAAKIAAAMEEDREKAALAAAAERRERAARARERQRVISGVLQGALTEATRQADQSQAEYEATMARLEAQAAAERRAQQQSATTTTRQTTAQRDSTIQIQAAPVVSQPPAPIARSAPGAGGTGSWETAGTPIIASSAEPASSGLAATLEAVIVCTIPGSDGRFRCATPVSAGISGGPRDSLPEYRTPELMAAHFKESCPGARKLRSSTHLVWGCGFGATNNSNSMDRSAGVDIQGRTTYYCSPKQTGCRRTSP